MLPKKAHLAMVVASFSSKNSLQIQVFVVNVWKTLIPGILEQTINPTAQFHIPSLIFLCLTVCLCLYIIYVVLYIIIMYLLLSMCLCVDETFLSVGNLNIIDLTEPVKTVTGTNTAKGTVVDAVIKFNTLLA